MNQNGPMSAVYKIEMYEVPLTQKSLWNQAVFCWSMEKSVTYVGYTKFFHAVAGIQLEWLDYTEQLQIGT